MRRNEQTEFDKYYWGYRRSYDESVAYMRSNFPQLGAFFEGLPSAWKPAEVVPANTPHASNAVARLLWDGRNLVHITLRDKSVPKHRIKAFEKAFRAFNWKRRPKNEVAWFARNLDNAKLLVDTLNWPAKGAATESSDDRVFQVGSFVVHDQTGGDVKATAQILARAEQLVRASDIPNADKALYGDVYFVGAIDRKRTILAQYYGDQDRILLLMTKRVEKGELAALLHEIGHRYYQRVWTAVQRRDWSSYDSSLRKAPDIKLPKVGDVVVLQQKTGPVRYHVSAYQPIRGKIFMTLAEGGMIDVDKYFAYAKQYAVIERLPTVYSRKDAEEHFCEAFSLYCRNELKEPHLLAFEKLVVGRSRAANPRHATLTDTVVRLQHAKSWKPKLPGGPRKHPRNFPTAALVRGAKVEFEHTNNPRLAVEIALSHLDEDIRYYEKLAVVERRHNPSCNDAQRVPFPRAPHPAAGSKRDDGAVVTSVRLADLTATQEFVSRNGLVKHGEPLPSRAAASRLPLVFKRDGKLYIIDGHHRLTAAHLRGEKTHRVRLVDLKKRCMNPARKLMR